MSHPEVSVKHKEKNGTSISKQIRNSGLTPAIVYGGAHESASLSLDLRDLSRVFRSSSLGRNTILNLTFEGSSKTELVLTHQLTRHPVTDKVIHIDFLRVQDNKPVAVEVPVELVGTPAGQRFGGILIKTKNSLTVSCLPENIPASIQIDVSAMQLGESIHLKDLTAAQGLTFLNNEKETLALIQVPREAKIDAQKATDGAAASPG